MIHENPGCGYRIDSEPRAGCPDPGAHHDWAVVLGPDTNVQHFTEPGIWLKPARAKTVTVTLKGGDGHPSPGGGQGGQGGWPASAPGFRMSAGGGGGGGATTHQPGKLAARGGEGGTAVKTFEASELPDRVEIYIGRGGNGFAHVVTELE